MKWFIDHAAAIKGKRLAEGLASFGTDPSGYGEWIADVERPAEQYRGRYQLRLDEARGLLRAGGARGEGGARRPACLRPSSASSGPAPATPPGINGLIAFDRPTPATSSR